MPKKKQKYQNLIYVELRENTDSNVYMLAYFDPKEAVTVEELYDGIEIGIYQFVKTAKVRTKIEII